MTADKSPVILKIIKKGNDIYADWELWGSNESSS